MFKYAICIQGAKLRLDQIFYKTGQFGLVGSSMAYLFCFGLVRQGLANFASITGAAITPLYASICIYTGTPRYLNPNLLQKKTVDPLDLHIEELRFI